MTKAWCVRVRAAKWLGWRDQGPVRVLGVAPCARFGTAGGRVRQFTYACMRDCALKVGDEVWRQLVPRHVITIINTDQIMFFFSLLLSLLSLFIPLLSFSSSLSLSLSLSLSPRSLARSLALQTYEHLNLFFTIIFTAELLFNIAANWFLPPRPSRRVMHGYTLQRLDIAAADCRLLLHRPELPAP